MKDVKEIIELLNKIVFTEEDEKILNEKLNKINSEQIEKLVDEILDKRHQKFMIDMIDYWSESDYRESEKLHKEILELEDKMIEEANKIENT